jgi:uncharacterized protein YeeX (DUF496 family)
VKLLHQQGGFTAQAAIQARVVAANAYFAKELTVKALNPVLKLVRVKPKNKIQQQIQHQLQKVRQQIDNAITLMHMGSGLLETQLKTEDYQAWIVQQRTKQKKVQESGSNSQEAITLQLF